MPPVTGPMVLSHSRERPALPSCSHVHVRLGVRPWAKNPGLPGILSLHTHHLHLLAQPQLRRHAFPAGSAPWGFSSQFGGCSRHRAPSERGSLRAGRNAPRCPCVAPWTPCSGGEWDEWQPVGRWQAVWAACEPGGGGRGGVPVHPARSTPAVRPPPNRRGPSRLGHAEPNALTSLSHCHRRVRCPVCTGGVTRTERGWVTAVNGAPQLGLGGTVSLEECHGPASV